MYSDVDSVSDSESERAVNARELGRLPFLSQNWPVGTRPRYSERDQDFFHSGMGSMISSRGPCVDGLPREGGRSTTRPIWQLVSHSVELISAHEVQVIV